MNEMNHFKNKAMKLQSKLRKMKTLKLQVGKTYRSREGEEVKIIKMGNMGWDYWSGNNGEWYYEGGKWSYAAEGHPKDLIEEVRIEPTRHTFDIPDGVKKVTVEQVGNRIVVEMVSEERKEPKPGDVMINDNGNVYIFEAFDGKKTHKHYCSWLESIGQLSIRAFSLPGRPATSEEAQPLWDALKKAGKRWNPETMQVEEIPEKEKIEKFLEGYAKGVRWSHKQLRCLIEDYLKHREGGK
jgi:hypothetical protein